MKLSVQSLWRNAVKTAQRFPVVVADALVVTALALTNNWGYAKGGAYPKLLLTFILRFSPCSCRSSCSRSGGTGRRRRRRSSRCSACSPRSLLFYPDFVGSGERHTVRGPSRERALFFSPSRLTPPGARSTGSGGITKRLFLASPLPGLLPSP